MRNFTLTLSLAVAALTAGAQVAAPVSPELMPAQQNLAQMRSQQQDGNKKMKRAKGNLPQHYAPQFKVGAPSSDLKVIEDTPEGESRIVVKTGVYYAYSWFTGMITASLDGSVSHMVTSPDGKKMYMQNPVSGCPYSEYNWIEGDVEGDILTFTFPQLISAEYYYDDEEEEEYAYLDYAMKLEFVPEEEGSATGWYYPTDDQTFRFRILPDGSLESLEGNCMIGQTDWLESSDGEYRWSWQANGDIIATMSELTGEANVLPEGVELQDWQLKTTYSTRKVGVGISGDTMYITNLYTGMSDVPAIGKIEGDKVVFETGQLFGINWEYNSTAYFLAGQVETQTDEYGDEYKYFVMSDTMTFDYDKENNILDCKDGAYCISSVADRVYYYTMLDKPYICIPEGSLNATSLVTPILDVFYDFDDEYDYDAEFYFIIPSLDADRQILDKSRIFYQIIMDDEIYVFYNDEYYLPEGVEEWTEIPFGYDNYWENEDGWGYDFDGNGIYNGLVFHARYFDSLGVRSLYKNPDGTTVYSDVLWAPGYRGDFVKAGENLADSQIESVRYYDLNGMRINRPEKGIFVRQTTMTDGTVRTDKVVRR